MGTRNYVGAAAAPRGAGCPGPTEATCGEGTGRSGSRSEMKPSAERPAPGRPVLLQRGREGEPHGPSGQPGAGQRRRAGGLREKQLSAQGQAGHGSQAPRSVLSRERLWVLRGDAGLGGLLRLELLDAVECLGESESSPS